MSEKKDQKIIVLLSFNDSDKTLILNGIKISTIFRKELCLVYNGTKKEKKNHERFKVKLIDYIQPIKKELPGLKLSTLLLWESKTELPAKLADDYEAIFVIAKASEYSKYSTAVTESVIPFLFTNENCTTVPAYKKLILPIDMQKQSSESALWGSYFGRFNNSELIVIAANDKGRESEQEVTKSIILSKKLFKKFKINHKVFKGTKSSLRNAFEALEYALSSECDLLVLLGSSTITPIDLLIGLPERKIIKKAGDLPVLVINPRRDNYMLCD